MFNGRIAHLRPALYCFDKHVSSKTIWPLIKLIWVVWGMKFFQTSRDVIDTSKSNQQYLRQASTWQSKSGLILGLSPANEGRRYFVTTYRIGWAQAKISIETKCK